MIKQNNIERSVVLILIASIISVPFFYNLADFLLYVIRGDDFLDYGLSWDYLVYIIPVILFWNIALHISMESVFKISFHDSYFEYKTLLSFKKTIEYIDIKKIVICKEHLTFKGSYGSIIVVRRGLRRNLFFNEFAMRKQDYLLIKNMCERKIFQNKIVYKNGFLYKQIALIFMN